MRALGVVGVAALAPTPTAVLALMPSTPLKPFLPSHPDFAQPGSVMRGADFRALAETVDALVEHARDSG